MSSSLINKMANLLCSERTEPPRGIEDPVLGDVSVGKNLLSLQTTTQPPFDYFLWQCEIIPFMRKVVANWMHAVCEEQRCEDTIFPLAMNYFDRFLCTTNVLKSQLQLVGTVCMLIASKMRQLRYFNLELLSEYTQYSITTQEIQAWELVVVAKLNWDLSPVIPNDIVDYVLVRSKIPLSKSSIVRRHTLTMVCLAILDESCIMMKPSLIAAGALGAAARGLGYIFPSETMAELIEDDALYVEQAIAVVSRLLEEESAINENQPASVPEPRSDSPVPEEYIPPFKYISDDGDFYDGNETPTDVTDVSF